MKNYDTICQELEQIAEERHDDTGVNASGFAAKLEKFATYVGLKLSFLVFSATEQLSITLQTSGTNAQEALTAAKAAKLYLERQRSETAFDLFWKSCEDESPMYEFVKQPVLPRPKPKQPPKWYNSGAQTHVYTSPKESFRQQYYEGIDLLVNEMDRRFDQKTFSILQEMVLKAFG